ncbi:hypothetical protein [Streptomyces sp. H39-S7]|uniref:hypothetical protein n=1 Tax=Streptomyces sp. H39-S7 TaxID=3004357 RepID=UPI003FA6BCD6
MLSLRVARGSVPTVLLRRLLVAAAAAGTGLLLLAALGYALGHPGDPSASSARLVWCLLPFAVALQLAVAVSRAEPSGRLHAGLAAVGLGRNVVPLLAAATTGLSCALGSAVALVVYLRLRGTAVEALGPENPLPFAGALVLLAAVPLLAAAASAASLWPRGADPSGPASADADDPGALSAVAAPAGLPWGVALTAIGLADDLSS